MMSNDAYLRRLQKMIDDPDTPDYLRDALERKLEHMQRQHEAAKTPAQQRAEESRRKEKLMAPPSNVRRIGRTLLWDPPETADELRPDGYWIREQRGDGVWVWHGDYQSHRSREAQLRTDRPASVSAHYSQLGRRWSDPLVAGAEPWWIVSRVRYYCTERQHGETHVNRWRRVLAAFGVVEAKRGHASRPLVSPLDPPMTFNEAQSYASRGWQRWVPVAKLLRRLQASRD